ncbi:MAG TPA: phosphodiester glycosidase family protein [Steroidobacteraceae bacterium]
MSRWSISAAAIAAMLTLHAAALCAQASNLRGSLPASRLAIRADGRWTTWWEADSAPTTWRAGDARLAAEIAWHSGSPGVEWGEFVIAGSGEAWRTRVIVTRIDPTRVRFRLDTAFTRPLRPDWSLARVRDSAAVSIAFNAGQFVDAMPWGWVVLDGRQFLADGAGPLAIAVVGDSAGAIYWMPADSVSAARPGRIAWAFESYPELLRADTLPDALRAAGRGVDVAHRDARLALGRLRDGRLLVALSRFDALGKTLGFVPFGLTVPEMAALMGALGCRDAVLLDGGISAQLLVRDSLGAPHEWKAVRKVPLALIGTPH